MHCVTDDGDQAGLNIASVRTSRDWPDAGRAVAGVDTYGLSGTFVHLLVGESSRH
jgi:acyl transferase domain-containing protein